MLPCGLISGPREMMATRLCRLLILIAALIATPSTLCAGEDFFLIMFGSQRVPSEARYSHTFASFVRATWEGDCPCPFNATLEEHTISWLPCSGEVRPWAVHPEIGRNFGLHETIRWCIARDMRISIWGAYRIDRELHDRAIAQIHLLRSGQVRYKCVDSLYPTDRASNCIHAVGSISQGTRLRVVSPGWGEPASFLVLKEFQRWICDPQTTHPWVGSALGLDEYCLIYRDYHRPRSGAISGPVFRLLGSERDLQATKGPPVPR